MQSPPPQSQAVFLQLKSICVPLLSHARLDNREIPNVLSLLSDLTARLQALEGDRTDLTPALVSYVFFPLSTILSRNDSSSIPDQVLERIFHVLELLFRSWWWTCEDAVWAQVLMLAGAVVGGLGGKGKGRERDDETKEAAVRLLLCLLRDRTDTEDADKARARLNDLQVHAQSDKLVPVLGQTLNALLVTATSEHLPLQLCSLQTVQVIVSLYVPDAVVPSILPGVVSTSTRIALGRTSNVPKGKAWVNGSVVAASLRVLDVVVIRCLGDEACLAAGIVKELNGLEDLTELVSGDAAASSSSQSKPNTNPFETTRSVPWLRASSSQLLIALNTLSSLVSHPTPSALLALSSLAQSLLSNARLTLPDAHPLLLSFLLSLSNARFPSVASHARAALAALLAPAAKGSHALLQTLLQHTADSLAALPRLLPARADARVAHAAGQVEAACRLRAAGAGVGRLLGPAGHIEKWGWRLLAVLEFGAPVPAIAVGAGVAGLLESAGDERIVFPEATLRHVSARETHVALERMLRALGAAGGDTCLFAVEWFVRVGSADRHGPGAVAALWCACRILEGVVGVVLDDERVEEETRKGVRGRRVEKLARWVAKTVSEVWDKEEEDVEDEGYMPEDADDEGRPAIEFVKGLTPLQTRFDIRSSSNSTTRRQSQPILYKSSALQLIAVSSSILQSRFSPLLIHALYPMLHSLVAPDAHLAGSAFAALQHVTRATGYATPGNLLLANFDYALDAVSRRLSRRWLDIDAARVLAVLVRLVGRDVVQRAGDVVEECFDRLDDFHGYTVVVEGLVEALLEVVRVVGAEEPPQSGDGASRGEPAKVPDEKHFADLLDWLEHRNDPPVQPEEEDIGPVPRTAWKKGKSKALSAEEEEEGKKATGESDSPAEPPPPPPSQALTAQIVTRSIALLTHGAPAIRARILTLLAAAAPALPAPALLPAVHRAWPFVRARLADADPRVAAAAAALVAALARAHGAFMAPRVWDDVWPCFRAALAARAAADAGSALARRAAPGAAAGVGTASAHTHSHRLYRAMLGTLGAALRGGAPVPDARAWDVLVAFRPFLHRGAHAELQAAARALYVACAANNEDAVWLVLTSTAAAAAAPGVPHLEHLAQTTWDIQENVDMIFADLSSAQE